MGLLAVSQGCGIPKGLPEDLAASAPEDMAAIANVGHLHTVLTTAFDHAPELTGLVEQDLQIFFAEMARANADRNRALLAQLARLGAAFSARAIPAVALKGSAELLSPTYADPAQRFIADTDILVPADRMDEAVEALLALGGQMVEEDKAFMHHLPPIMLPDGAAPIELHLRIGNDLVDRMLPADEVLASALPHETGLLVPDPATRLTHLVVHGQIHHEHHALRALYLRDCLDYFWMEKQLGIEAVERTRAVFLGAGQGVVLDGFVTLTNAIFGKADQQHIAPAARPWADATLAVFGAPGRRKARESLAWFATCVWRFVKSSEYRKYYLGVLRDRQRLRAVLAVLGDRMRRIQ